jgi:hypothetical protein
MTVGWSLFKDRSGQKSVRLEEGAVGAPSLTQAGGCVVNVQHGHG